MQHHGRANADCKTIDRRDERRLACRERLDESKGREIPPAAPLASRKSPISLPAVNMPPDPANTTAPIDGSRPACRKASVAAKYMAPVSAFFLSGRSKVTQSTAPSRSILTFGQALIIGKKRQLPAWTAPAPCVTSPVQDRPRRWRSSRQKNAPSRSALAMPDRYLPAARADARQARPWPMPCHPAQEQKAANRASRRRAHPWDASWSIQHEIRGAFQRIHGLSQAWLHFAKGSGVALTSPATDARISAISRRTTRPPTARVSAARGRSLECHWCLRRSPQSSRREEIAQRQSPRCSPCRHEPESRARQPHCRCRWKTPWRPASARRPARRAKPVRLRLFHGVNDQSTPPSSDRSPEPPLSSPSSS